jgi:hypothetical protein
LRYEDLDETDGQQQFPAQSISPQLSPAVSPIPSPNHLIDPFSDCDDDLPQPFSHSNDRGSLQREVQPAQLPHNFDPFDSDLDGPTEPQAQNKTDIIQYNIIKLNKYKVKQKRIMVVSRKQVWLPLQITGRNTCAHRFNTS